MRLLGSHITLHVTSMDWSKLKKTQGRLIRKGEHRVTFWISSDLSYLYDGSSEYSMIIENMQGSFELVFRVYGI